MRLVKTALELPIEVGAALLASAEGYTPRATKLIDEARERLGSIEEIAFALAENLPAPKQQPGKSRRRRRRKRKKPAETVEQAAPAAAGEAGAAPVEVSENGGARPAAAPRPRRRRKPKQPAPAEPAEPAEDEAAA